MRNVYTIRLLECSLIVTIESNGLEKEYALNLFNEMATDKGLHSLFFRIASIESKQENEVNPYDRFCKYFTDKYINYIDAFKFNSSLINYILTGYYNEEKLNNEIQSFVDVMTKDKIHPVTKRVRQFIDNWIFYENDTDFILQANECLELIEAGGLELSLYDELFCLYVHFVENKLIEESRDNIKQKTLDGIKKACKNIRPVDFNRHFSIEEKVDPDVRDVRLKIQECMETYKDGFIKTQVSELFSLLPYEIDKFKNELLDANGIFRFTHVFSHYDYNQLYNKIIHLSNADIYTFIKILNELFKIGNPDETYRDEISHLRKLSDLIQEYNKTNDDRINKYNLNILLDTINKIYNKINQLIK